MYDETENVWRIINKVTQYSGGVHDRDKLNWQSLVRNLTQSVKTNNFRLDPTFFNMIDVLSNNEI